MQEVTEEVHSNVHFFKLHAPWPVLCKYAEELNLRAPLQVCIVKLHTQSSPWIIQTQNNIGQELDIIELNIFPT